MSAIYEMQESRIDHTAEDGCTVIHGKPVDGTRTRFVIKRTDQGGGYVTSGSKSYTENIRDATIYPTLEKAERHRCPDNEITVPLSSELSSVLY